MRAVRGLVPYALMHESVFLGKPASERDDLGEGKFDDAARVRERSVEDRDAALRGGFEIDLVRADAERANGDEVRCRLEYPPRDVRLRSDAEDGHVLRGLYQFRLVVSPVDVLDGQTGLVQHCCGVRMDVLEQEGSLGSTERIRHNVFRTKKSRSTNRDHRARF